MRFFVIGSSHVIAPVSVRERFAASLPSLEEALIELRQKTQVAEALLLSTCNRFEGYVCTHDIDPIIEWLTDKTGMDRETLRPYLYVYEGQYAITHLFRVACGLDSMMLGETQILKQIKNAFKTAVEVGSLDKYFKSLFQATLTVAKSIRHQTHIGHHSLSIPATVLNLAKAHCSDFTEQNVLLIGAGEMISLCAHQLSTAGFNRLTIANRRQSQANLIAEPIDAETLPLADVTPEYLRQFEIIVCCTASPHALLSKQDMEITLSDRQNPTVLIIDLAVPRDVEPGVGALEGVLLYTIDDLGEMVRLGKIKREHAAGQAEMMVKNRVEEFINWWRHRRHVPLIYELQTHAEQINQTEIDRALRELSQGKSPETVLEQFGHRLINKLLHVPIQALHDAPGNDIVANNIAESYGIDYPQQPPPTVTL